MLHHWGFLYNHVSLSYSLHTNTVMPNQTNSEPLSTAKGSREVGSFLWQHLEIRNRTFDQKKKE